LAAKKKQGTSAGFCTLRLPAISCADRSLAHLVAALEGKLYIADMLNEVLADAGVNR